MRPAPSRAPDPAPGGEPEHLVDELARILARGYLRPLPGRIGAHGAAQAAPEPSNSESPAILDPPDLDISGQQSDGCGPMVNSGRTP